MPESPSDVAARRIRNVNLNRSYESYQMMQRSRRLSDNTHFSMCIEVLSRSGSTVKDTVGTAFPQLTGGYAEYRERCVYGDNTDFRWYVANKKHVMTKTDHLPTAAEMMRCSTQQFEWLAEENERKGIESDLPEHLKQVPRVLFKNPPERGETAAMVLDGDFHRAVPLEDRQLYRLCVTGREGTNGETHRSIVFSGKQIMEHVHITFKKRRDYMAYLQRGVDGLGPGEARNVSHNSLLVCGSTIPCRQDSVTADAIDDGAALLSYVKLAWSSSDPKTRKLVMVGAMATINFARPSRVQVPVETAEAAEADVCACCLEDLEEDVWSCGTCHKCMHPECFSGWLDMCSRHGNAVTCPNCRADVAA